MSDRDDARADIEAWFDEEAARITGEVERLSAFLRRDPTYTALATAQGQLTAAAYDSLNALFPGVTDA